MDVTYYDSVTQLIVAGIYNGFVQNMQLTCLREENNLNEKKKEKKEDGIRDKMR